MTYTTETGTNVPNETTSASTACNYTNACAYKLPCGLCRLTMSECPKGFSYPNITWTASELDAVVNPVTRTIKAVGNDE